MHVARCHPSRPLGFETSGIAGRIASRLEANPRLRQRVRSVPGRLANPVWVDDEHFDLSYHVRRSALPSPGSTEQLTEFVARVNARLPRPEPATLGGLRRRRAGGDRFAVVTKTHQAVIDEVTALDIAGLVLDLDEQTAVPASTRPWSPRPAPARRSSSGRPSGRAQQPGQPRRHRPERSERSGENGRRALGVTTTLARRGAPGPTTPFAVDPGAA